MHFLTTAIAAAAMGLAAGAANANEIVNIDATNAVGTTVNLAAGTYTVSYAGIAGGGLYDGFSLYNTGGFTDELAITLGASTNFNSSATYDYLMCGSQALYATAHKALLAYQNALSCPSSRALGVVILSPLYAGVLRLLSAA